MRCLVLITVFCATSGLRIPDIKSRNPHTQAIGQVRIVGGEEATYGEFPHQVSVQAYDSYMCGGSIYNTEWVITAGHCCDGFEIALEFFDVSYGTHRLNEQDEYQGTAKVAEIELHPEYDGLTGDNDICLIHLKEPLVFNDYVNSISLPPLGQEQEPGTMCIVSGWGALEENGELSDVLMKTSLPVVSDADCSTIHGEEYNSDNEICAGLTVGGVDYCQGDDGGPFMCGGQLTGIVKSRSWDQGCAQPNVPGIYTQVSYFVDWVVATAGEA